MIFSVNPFGSRYFFGIKQYRFKVGRLEAFGRIFNIYENKHARNHAPQLGKLSL